MEIIELITFHLNKLESVLEVSFRTNSDNEDLIREGKISYIDLEDFGYYFHNNSDSIDELIDVDDLFYGFDDEDLFIDESEILSFLNEYYTLHIDKLPKAEFL
jgi:hypothetical protein